MTGIPAPRWRILARTDLSQLRKRAKSLLRAYRARQREAIGLFDEFHHEPPGADRARLADAQLVLARAHDYPGWPALRRAVELFNAICDDDPERVLESVRRHPALLRERVNGRSSNWGPPLACAAQVGASRVVRALLTLAGDDVQWALDRAILKGRAGIAQALIDAGATPEAGVVMGPCESLNPSGLEFLARIGAPLTDARGDRLAPVGLLLEGYFRDPDAKHACLDFFARQGIDYPDTPAVAFHRGRIADLERHLAGDPRLLERRFGHREIYPPELGCHADESLALHGTPLDGTTLLHMAIDFDEADIFHWALENGADVDERARPAASVADGHTPLFGTVVSQAFRSGRQRDGTMARVLLERGADAAVRASIRKRIRFIEDESEHVYGDVTPLEYGRRFHGRAWVNDAATDMLAEATRR